MGGANPFADPIARLPHYRKLLARADHADSPAAFSAHY